MYLKVERAFSYEGRFPFFSEPREIGSFSLGNDRNYFNDTHQLKYLVLPQNMEKVSMDLNENYSQVIKKDFWKKENIDTLLKWILSHQEEVKKHFFDSRTSSVRINFVCFRGLLTVICSTIYENLEDWIICATKYKSVIYLCAFKSESTIRRQETMTEKDKLMCSWGYKFEQYMVADTLNSVPDLSVPVNEKEEYNSVMKGRLTHHNILFSAEVDAVDPAYLRNPDHDPSSMQRYVELKTSKIITNERVERSFCRYKLLKWWLQSFLAGVPRVICGFRNDEGIVHKLENFNVNEMSKMSKGLWSPAACLNFCSRFLDFVQECVIKDDPLYVYKFTWKPKSNITCEELGLSSEFRILPDWYIEKLTI